MYRKIPTIIRRVESALSKKIISSKKETSPSSLQPQHNIPPIPHITVHLPFSSLYVRQKQDRTPSKNGIGQKATIQNKNLLFPLIPRLTPILNPPRILNRHLLTLLRPLPCPLDTNGLDDTHCFALPVCLLRG